MKFLCDDCEENFGSFCAWGEEKFPYARNCIHFSRDKGNFGFWSSLRKFKEERAEENATMQFIKEEF